MTKTTEIVVLEDTQPPKQPPPAPPQQPHLQIPNIFSMFPKFNLQFPFLNPPKPKHGGESPSTTVAAPVGDDEGRKGKDGGDSKPSVVRFPKAQIVTPPPLEAEVEETGTKTSNPIIIWQVYAIGAFFISRWIWARWNERKDRKAQGKSPNDGGAEGTHSDDVPRSLDSDNINNDN